jgi:uncharacterized LabA/DUF88 family protein
MRVSAFIDGFNFYHAVHDLGQPHLKWVNLRSLVETFAPAPQYTISNIYYFSAFATWRPGAYARHRQFIAALRAAGVVTVMGRFKEKPRGCNACGRRWVDHEEKETDVNIALHLLLKAHQDEYDRAFLISGDSDLAPAVRMVRSEFPTKQVRILMPPARGYSMDLVNSAGGLKAAKKMEVAHLERCLLPEQVRDASGSVVAKRPPEYAPPARS